MPEDLLIEHHGDVELITINRPEVRYAFRPTTLFELSAAFERARNDPTIGVIILTGVAATAVLQRKYDFK